MRSRLTAAATVSAFALLIVTHPVIADAARMVTGADIRNGTVTAADIENKTVTAADIKDGTLLSKDFRTGVLPVRELRPRPSTVTELRSWTVHFDAHPQGYPRQVTSDATLPPGTLVSGIDIQARVTRACVPGCT